jgi:hypothetical protein
MKRWMTLGMMAMAPFLGAGAAADTIFFKDGTSLDGKASQPHPNVVRLDVEGGHLTFPANTVLRIEENDKTGQYSTRINIHTVRHVTMMEELSGGLSGDEQAELFQLMEPLNSEDAGERHRAAQAILAVGQEKDITDFLALVTTSTTERYLPQVLEILAALDPERAREVSTMHLTQQHPVSRSAALAQLARVAGADAAPTVAQGLVDHDPEVQVTAAMSLGQTGAREATPALLAALDSPHNRVRIASEQALRQLWGVADAQSPQEWRNHWNEHQASVSSPINPASLTPLVEEEDPLTTTAYHE